MQNRFFTIGSADISTAPDAIWFMFRRKNGLDPKPKRLDTICTKTIRETSDTAGFSSAFVSQCANGYPVARRASILDAARAEPLPLCF